MTRRAAIQIAPGVRRATVGAPVYLIDHPEGVIAFDDEGAHAWPARS